MDIDKLAEAIPDSCVLMPTETDFLKKYAGNAKHNLVELGSLSGRSSLILGAVAQWKKVKLYCVDTWPENDVMTKWALNIEAAELSGIVNSLKGTCMDAVYYLKDVKFDFLFMDATHDTEGLIKEFGAYVAIMEKPATIVIHDTHMGKVLKAFNAVKGNNEFVIEENIGVILIKGKPCKRQLKKK